VPQSSVNSAKPGGEQCLECVADRVLERIGPWKRNEHSIITDTRTIAEALKIVMADNERLRNEARSQ